MTKFFSVILIVASATIFSCANSKQSEEKEDETTTEETSVVADADKIEYSYHPSTVAPKYYRGYTITVTSNNLHLAINSYSDTLLRKDWSFTKAKFIQLKSKLKNLKEDGQLEDDKIGTGGTSQTIIFYKNDRKIFTGEDYQSTKNFSGAAIDLSYLIPDLKELIAETEANEE